MTSSRVFCCFFLLLVGEALSALRLVPLVGVAAGGLDLPCEALRVDWRVPAMVDRRRRLMLGKGNLSVSKLVDELAIMIDDM